MDYTPEYSYLCFMTSDTAEKSKGVSHVADVFTYENEYKIDPALMSKISENRGKKSAKGIDVPDLDLEVGISTFGTDDSNLTREIENLGASNVYQSGKDIYAKVLPNIVEKLSAGFYNYIKFIWYKLKFVILL
ncbi:MAG: hypothetical protein GX383_05890 [Clostridium sp.]|nr:hypothetical protein [Clostridium sp.]